MHKICRYFVIFILCVLLCACKKQEKTSEFDNYTLPLLPPTKAASDADNPPPSALQEGTMSIGGAEKQAALTETTPPPLNTKEFWDREEDLYSKYDIDQESISTYAIVKAVEFNEAQQRYIVIINPVREEYVPRAAVRDDGVEYTAYDLVPKTESNTIRLLLDPSGSYSYADPCSPDFSSSRTVPLIQFADIAATRTSDGKPLYFKIDSISGTVISARLWDMYYLNAAYNERIAAQAQSTPIPFMTPFPTIPQS